MKSLSPSPPRVRLRRAPIFIAGTLASIVLSGCGAKMPKGQVVAVVNGEEVTTQDLQAEQRALGTGPVSPRVLTQRVVDRVLLAQAAHAERLDADPGLPADMLRLRQDYLVQRLIRADVKPAPPPTPGQVDGFIRSHPLLFAERARLSLSELRFEGVDDSKTLQGLTSLDAIEARLKMLNTTVVRSTVTLDTAQVPAELAAKLLAQPTGQIFYIRLPNATVAATIDQRTPIAVSPEQAQGLARQFMVRIAGEQAVAAKLKVLGAKAKVAYQPGFSPPKGAEGAGVEAPVQAPDANAQT